MAAPDYTTDLLPFDLAEDTGSWIEFTNMSGGGSPAEDDGDNEIQGIYMTSQTCNTTGVVSMGVVKTGVTLPSLGVFLVWHQLTSPGAMDTYTNGGLRLVVGTDVNNWKAWAVGGKLTPPNPYGGWQNNPIDPTIAYEYSYGTPPTTTYAAVGSACNLLSGIFKGNPHQCDAIRYGRAEARMAGGETANYATFSGFAAKNDANDVTDGYNRWGLIQSIMGGFFWKGLMTLGYGSAVDFRDQNKNIFVQDTRKVQSGFNKIEVRQSGSRVDWTGISIAALGTVSKGMFEAIDDADINLDSCTFIDMSTFIFKPNSTILSSIFRRCDQVTAGGATFTECKFENSPAAASLLAASTTLITKCTFISDGSNHAIEIDTPGEYTFSGHTFVGYATENGSTGNEVIYNNSGGEVILNASGNTGTISYRNGPDASTVVNATVNVTIIANVSLVGAEVRIYDLDTTPPEYGTELAGIESNGTANYIYAGTEGNTILIQVMKDGYIEYTQEYIMPGSNSNLNILLKLDENS